MTRTPPKSVRAQLAAEVGFGCPAVDCGSPYLTWHHFDPPWNEHQHHEANGMIALCREHHDAADVGAYTVEQLREMKMRGRDRNKAIFAQFQWRRERLLGIVGGNFFYETAIAIQLGEQPLVWFNRDEQNNALVNVAMPCTTPTPRLRVEDNFWIEVGEPVRVECPPSGRRLAVEYANGDVIGIEFFDVSDKGFLDGRYPESTGIQGFLGQPGEGFPVTAVEILMRVHAPDGRPLIDLDAQESRIGPMLMRGNLVVRGSVGFMLG